MLRKLEGFESLRQMTQLARVYPTATGTIATQTGHRGVGSGVSSSDLVLTTDDLLGGAADQNDWVIGIALRGAGNPMTSGQATHPYVALQSAGGEQLRLDFIPDISSRPGGFRYKLRVARGATTLATSNETFDGANSELAWTYFEWTASVQTGTSGSFSVRYHTRRSKNQSVTWDSANTSVNTANQGAAGADRFEVSLDNDSAPVATMAIDNIYALDGSGSVNNAQIGEIDIELLSPQGNGDTTQWDLMGSAASLEDAWNESAIVQTLAEDQKRATAKDVGFISLVTTTNPSLIRSVTVVGIETRMTAHMEATGTRDVQFFYRKTTGSPAQTGGGVVTLSSTSLAGFSDVQETDPNTATAWVVADIDGLQVGVELDA
jgi:hypothetical protein